MAAIAPIRARACVIYLLGGVIVMWIAISVLCVIIAIIVYGARKANVERDDKTNDNKAQETMMPEEGECKVKIPLKIVSILLALLCIVLGGLCLHIRQRADNLNDALYLANITVDRVRDDNYRLKMELEDKRKELELLKIELMEERGNRKIIEHDYEKYREEVEYTGSIMGMLAPLHEKAANP